MIIGIVVGISVIIAFIFTIYFCRCCKWGHDTNDIFKDVDKDIVVNYKEAVPVKPTANGKDIKDNVKQNIIYFIYLIEVNNVEIHLPTFFQAYVLLSIRENYNFDMLATI